MGLLKILKKVKQREKEMRLLILYVLFYGFDPLISLSLDFCRQHRGLDNAGKTTIVKKINGESIDEISPTLGFNIKTLEYCGYVMFLPPSAVPFLRFYAPLQGSNRFFARSFRLNVWDVGGQTSLRSYWRNYYEATDGIVWVIDSADRFRLEDTRRELTNLLGQEKLAGASLLIMANKQDLPGSLSLETIRETLEFDQIASGHRHVKLQGCSAVTGDGLLDGLDWVIKDIGSRIYMLE